MSIFDKIEIDLKFAIKNKRNVLLTGFAGCGKTITIQKLFDKEYGRENWVYYSAPTLDPFTDLVGCPRVIKDENGKDYLELIKPKKWSGNTVKALFLDELPRAQKKVLNCLMELLLFKSINGQYYPNLEVIWAAQNPIDEGYSGEELDEAIKDRFPIQIDFPYEINYEYFEHKFSKQIANAVTNWWSCLDKDKKRLVSPRRLDNAVEIILAGGDVNNVLHQSTHPGKLLKEIKSGNILDDLQVILKKRNSQAKTKLLNEFFEKENNYFGCKEYIINHKNELLEYVNDERISELISNNEKMRDFMLSNLDIDKYKNVIKDIINANTNIELVNSIKKNINYVNILIENENKDIALYEEKLNNILNIDNNKKHSIKDNGIKNIDTNAKYVDFDNIDVDKIYQFIDTNQLSLVGSTYADECLIIINKKYPNKFVQIEELMHTIRQHGCN